MIAAVVCNDHKTATGHAETDLTIATQIKHNYFTYYRYRAQSLLPGHNVL